MNEIITRFNKNSMEEVRITLQEWKSKLYVDIRVWAKTSPQDPEATQVTKKGITLNVELLSKLRKAIDAVLARMEIPDEEEETQEAQDPGAGPEKDERVPF